MFLCNQCGAELGEAMNFCESCGSPTLGRQTSYATSPLQLSAAPARAPLMRRALHTQAAATAVCVACRWPFCAACLLFFNGQYYCLKCQSQFRPAMMIRPVPAPVYRTGPIPPRAKNPGVAFLLSFLMPGLGQFYNGDTGKGLFFFFGFWVLVWVAIGWLLWVAGFIDAYISARDISEGRRV